MNLLLYNDEVRASYDLTTVKQSVALSAVILLVFTFQFLSYFSLSFGLWILVAGISAGYLVFSNFPALPSIFFLTQKSLDQYSFFITLTWFLGLAEGLIFSFLNWYLEDLGASKLLMGVATVLRCSTIIFGFYHNSWVIEKFRYRAVFFWVLFSYMFSFVAYSILRDPWWILPIELIQGFTYGTAWPTCVTYMSVVTPANGAATAQGILHGVYWGLGGGLGAIFGGVIIHEYGVVLSFRAGSVASSIMLILFCLFEWWMARKEEKEELYEDTKKDLDLENK